VVHPWASSHHQAHAGVLAASATLGGSPELIDGEGTPIRNQVVSKTVPILARLEPNTGHDIGVKNGASYLVRSAKFFGHCVSNSDMLFTISLAFVHTIARLNDPLIFGAASAGMMP
jgi:hypothetical protein